MTAWDAEQHRNEIIRLSTLTKTQLWRELSEESAYQYMNEKSPLSYHFVSSVHGNGSVKSKREVFFSKKQELAINWTVTMFTERERKFRNLINASPLIHLSAVEDFIISILSHKTVEKRLKHFFAGNDYEGIIGKKEFLFLEKKHREYIFENKDESIEKLSKKLNELDKRSVVLEIKKSELDDTFKRLKDQAKSIPLQRKVEKEREMLVSGKAKTMINAKGEKIVVENEPWYYKIIYAIILGGIGYFIATYWDFSNPEQERLNDYCKKYYENYPWRDREDCEESWKEIQNWDRDRR